MKRPKSSRSPPSLSEVRWYAKLALEDDREGIERCVAFMESETRGIRHNRTRALISRRLKHCNLSNRQQSRLTSAILDRLVRGGFDEQFKDQLRLVLRLAPEQAYAAALSCGEHHLDHVQRYAAWVLAHEN